MNVNLRKYLIWALTLVITAFYVMPVQPKVMKNLEVTSTPSDAEVFFKKGNREIPIGKTPFTYNAGFHSDISVIRLVFRKKGYESKSAKVKASDNRVFAKLIGAQVAADPARLKDASLRSFQEQLNLIIERNLPDLILNEGKLDYDLERHAILQRIDGKVYLIIPILLKNPKEKFTATEDALLESIRETGWLQFGPNLVVPLAAKLEGEKGLHGIILDMKYDESGFTFEVDSHVETEIKMECVSGYVMQSQTTTCWQNGTSYSCVKPISIYAPCKYRRPVTHQKYVTDAQHGLVQGKAVIRYVIPIGLIFGKSATYNNISIVHKGGKGETIFIQGEVPGNYSGK